MVGNFLRRDKKQCIKKNLAKMSSVQFLESVANGSFDFADSYYFFSMVFYFWLLTKNR